MSDRIISLIIAIICLLIAVGIPAWALLADDGGFQ